MRGSRRCARGADWQREAAAREHAAPVETETAPSPRPGAEVAGPGRFKGMDSEDEILREILNELKKLNARQEHAQIPSWLFWLIVICITVLALYRGFL